MSGVVVIVALLGMAKSHLTSKLTRPAPQAGYLRVRQKKGANMKRHEIERLADNMDLQAENINAHDFVITHRALAILAYRTIGESATIKLFRALRRELGLPGLTGVAGREPERGTLLKRLGVAEDWGTWNLPNKALKKDAGKNTRAS